MVNYITSTVVFAIAVAQFLPITSQSNELHEVQADFAVRLLQEVSNSDRSSVISPLSISIALSILYEGAHGETKQQISDVLARGIGRREFETYITKLLINVVNNNRTRHKYMLDIASSLCMRRNITVKTDFWGLIYRSHGGGLRRVDFREKSAVATAINAWMASKTHGKINDLVSANSIDANTVMMLLNAAYFKGTWKKQFDTARTLNRQFQFAGNEAKQVPMMSMRAELPYFEDQTVQVLGLPYDDDQIQMFLILPIKRFALRDILKSLSGHKLLHYIRQCSPTKVEVQIPRFKLEKKLKLMGTLKKLGIIDVFSQKSDLRFISPWPLSVSDVTHEAFIEVDEEGVDEVGTTVDNRMLSYSLPQFNANHPFLFVIVKDLNTILFAGQFAK